MRKPYYELEGLDLERRVLWVRYQTESPTRQSPVYFSARQVANLLQVSQRHVESVLRKYFYRKYKKKERIVVPEQQKKLVTSENFLR